MQSNTLYKVKLVANAVPTSFKGPVFTDTPNAMAYHTGDNYMYAVAQKNNANGQIIRITNVGEGKSTGFEVATTSSVTSGTIDPDGYFWVAWNNAKSYAKIDLRPNSGTYGQTLLTGITNILTTPGNGGQATYYQVNDWAALGPTSGPGNRTGVLYTVAGQSGQATSTTYRSLLLSMTTDNPPVWAILATYTNFNGGTGGKADWGAMYPTSDGYLYATENTNGLIWRFNVATTSAQPEQVLQGPAGITNDGARCVTAPLT